MLLRGGRRAGAHNDLVLAVALACWWGEHAPWRIAAEKRIARWLKSLMMK